MNGKRKMGRPSMVEGEAKEIIISCKVSPRENRNIVAAIRKSEMSKAQWMRTAFELLMKKQNGKVGRPVVPPEKKRDIYVGFHFSRDEWRIVKRAIKDSDMDNSKWFVRACLREAKRENRKNNYAGFTTQPE